MNGRAKARNRTAFVTGGLFLWMVCALCPAATYEPTWESLTQHPVPEWFKDAKFGIYAHWGVYCVPAYGNEWYPRNMYLQDSDVYKHHVQTWGDPSTFGYKDFIPLFKAEHFDAEEWAELYEQAGAKFAGPVAEHHDGFSMWASRVNRWNAADMGPKRDVVGELVRALRKRDIKIIASFHHAYNFQGYYTAKEGWDTADPRYADFYGQLAPEVAHRRWLAKLKEVIDAYQPDQIWFDFGLGKIPDDFKQQMAAYYYNQEQAWGKPVIITRKNDYLPEGVGVLDIERGKMEGAAPFLWQTDDSVATNTWCWTSGIHLKSAEELVHELIDIVSKNGVLLLNVCPKADGTFPDDQKALLREIGDWLRVNGPAIYGTRPWTIHGEGPNLYDRGRGLGGTAQGQVEFSSADVRFTTRDQRLYAIALGWPGGPMTLESLRVEKATPDAAVRLLGSSARVDFRVDDQKRMTLLPPKLDADARPCRHAFAFELSGFTLAVDPFALPGAVTLAADKALLNGRQLRTEERGGRTNIGFWDRPDEDVHWLARVDRAGRYTVRAELAAAAGDSRLTLSAGRESVSFTVPRTATWDNARWVPVGTLEFDAPGVYHIILKAADPSVWRAVNVWQIQLAPDK